MSGHGDEDTLIVSSEHIPIRSFTFLALEKNIHFDLSVLLSGFVVVNVTLAIKISDDDNSFFVMIIV